MDASAAIASKLIAHDHYPPRWGAQRRETALYFSDEYGYFKVVRTGRVIRTTELTPEQAQKLFFELPYAEVGEGYQFKDSEEHPDAEISIRFYDIAPTYDAIRTALSAGRTVKLISYIGKNLRNRLLHHGIRAEVHYCFSHYALKPADEEFEI